MSKTGTPRGLFKTEHIDEDSKKRMLRSRPPQSPRSLAKRIAGAMSSTSNRDTECTSVSSGFAHQARKLALSTSRQRHPLDCVWMLGLVQRLLLREMRLQKLSLRKAARTSGVPLGTLSHLLDPERISDPDKWPKQPLRRGTLRELRAISWLRPMSVRAFDCLLELTERTTKR